jgi:hypothetical protein
MVTETDVTILKYGNLIFGSLSLLFLCWAAWRESKKRQLSFTILARISHIFLAIKIISGIFMALAGWKYSEFTTTAAHVVMELFVLLVLTEILRYVYVILPPLTINHIRGFQVCIVLLWASLCGGRLFKGLLYETSADDHWAAKVPLANDSGIDFALQSGTALLF